MADRHFGIGCDQLLVVEPPTRAGADFRYRIFNADGGEVEQCGNGARCFVRFVHEQGLTSKSEIRVETARGIILPRLENDGEVTVDMGTPCFLPAEIPFVADAPALTYALLAGGAALEISALSMGNPHAVQIVDNVDTSPVAELGPLIERHERFPQRVNAGFMQILNPHRVRLRVHERGAGETLACGTGACAAAVAGIRLGKLVSPVTVGMRGGELVIRWAGAGASVMMTGPATTVFEGTITL
jgi:diaminopimelate epimerase